MEASAPSAAETVRRLCRGRDRAALSTAARDANGWPCGSAVLAACRFDGAPLLLLSRLAVHTANLAADSRLCLLYDEMEGRAEPLAAARVGVLGRAGREDDPAAAARFLRRHPGAARYAGFADFSFYRVAVERVHLVAGFGAVERFEGAALKALLAAPAAPALERGEERFVESLNAAGAADAAACARRFGGGEGWRATGADPFGVDLRRGGEVARIPFARPVETPAAARAALAELARGAARPGAK